MRIVKTIAGLLIVGVTGMMNGIGNYAGKVMANRIHKKVIQAKNNNSNDAKELSV